MSVKIAAIPKEAQINLSFLNSDCHAAVVDRAALEQALHGQGEDFLRAVTDKHAHLFAAVPLFVSAAQVAQMRAVIEAVERVVALPAWRDAVLSPSPSGGELARGPAGGEGTISGEARTLSPTLPPGGREYSRHEPRAKGVFFGYDFHLNDSGAQLLEINTNAGGALLNALLVNSQRDVHAPGTAALPDNLEPAFLDMFRREWKLQRGDAPLRTVAIVDETPPAQYFYPEFILAQQLFERAGITAWIADPAELQARGDGLYCGEHKVDLVYNRLTDFSLQLHPALLAAYQQDQLVLTPHPLAYSLYANKRNLALLTDGERLRAMGADEATIATLRSGIPQTRLVASQHAERWWQQRKQWFFKPATGFGSKGTYRGANLTKRVFEEIMQADYVAQRMAPPGGRSVCVDGAEPVSLKFDVRCYVYDGQVQLIAARLYQGQTTNLRTPGGGFAVVRVVS